MIVDEQRANVLLHALRKQFHNLLADLVLTTYRSTILAVIADFTQSAETSEDQSVAPVH